MEGNVEVVSCGTRVEFGVLGCDCRDGESSGLSSV
jgi:hypothetical protein